MKYLEAAVLFSMFSFFVAFSLSNMVSDELIIDSGVASVILNGEMIKGLKWLMTIMVLK